MKKKYRDNIFLTVRGFLKFLLVHSFLVAFILIGGYIFLDVFIYKQNNTTSLTYYGFAIFAAFANICFSYARTFGADDNQILYLRNVGERFLFCAIGFLLGSLMKYSAPAVIHSVQRFAIAGFVTACWDVITGLFFLSSFMYGGTSVHSLLDHLFEKIMLNKHNYYIGDNKE